MNSENLNVASAPKTATFQMRINPEVKRAVEAVYEKNGLSFTDAVNIFIQQSINADGLPFLLSAENEEYMRAKALRRLMSEIDKGRRSADTDAGLIAESDVYRSLGIDEA